MVADASALFAIRLANENAATSYAFELQLPRGAVVEYTDEGGLFYLNADGQLLGGTAPPWARDAKGKEVPTWFTLEENVLRQHVDLGAVADIAYPVIADPYQGQWLVSGAYVTYQSDPNRYVVRAVPTEWGRQQNNSGLLSYHTDDLLARLGTLAHLVTPTIENQFHCHVVFNAAGGGPTYDMESWRPNVFWWAQAVFGCNP